MKRNAHTPAMRRQQLEALIEQMIAMLDEMDGDENLEDIGDDEPSLSARHRYCDGHAEYDLEADDAEEEPSLGWTDAIDQSSRSRLGEAGLEPDREIDGDEGDTTFSEDEMILPSVGFDGSGARHAESMIAETPAALKRARTFADAPPPPLVYDLRWSAR